MYRGTGGSDSVLFTLQADCLYFLATLLQRTATFDRESYTQARLPSRAPAIELASLARSKPKLVALIHQKDYCTSAEEFNTLLFSFAASVTPQRCLRHAHPAAEAQLETCVCSECRPR